MDSTYLIVNFLLICNLLIATSSAMFIQPTFDRTNENVTVIIGNSAVLPCFISNLGDHKVAWIKVANMDILAIGDYRVTNDDRIKLLHGYLSDWSLSIQPVNEEDAGEYICQINTEPQIITRIFLHVLLPPKIIEEKSTLMTGPIQEGQTLKLQCHADGIPTPKVTWFFRKKVSHHSNSQQQHNHHQPHSIDLSQSNNIAKYFDNQLVIQDENTLIINNVSRTFSGLFECIANNTVPPAASRKIRISVEFSPEISVQSDKVEQLAGLDARFECRIKANPLLNHYWMKDGHVIENNYISSDLEHKNEDLKELKSSSSDSRYEINIYNQNSIEFLTVSVLLVKNITKNDFGVYECFAVNSLNTTKSEIELKEIVMRRQTATKIAASRILFYSNLHQEPQNNENPQPIQSTTPSLSVYTKHLLYSPKLARKSYSNHTAKQHVNRIKQQNNVDQEKDTSFSLFNNKGFVSLSSLKFILFGVLLSNLLSH